MSDSASARALQRLGSISIDVDGIDCYHAIHGLPPAERDPIYDKALPRFLDAVEAIGAKATLFVIGQDLEHDGRRDVIRRAAEAGHEIASHSYAHDYSLSVASPAAIDADLTRAADVIEDVTGRRPRGFRAPGYNQSEALFDALERQHVTYDSSFFPTPAYFAARAAALLKYRLTGRTSQSLVGDVREFASRRDPFFPSRDRRFRRARQGARRSFVELPMTVSSPLRMPWLGTTVALFPDVASRALTEAVVQRRGPVVLELHGMEFLGADDGVDDALVQAQPDLQVPLDDKLRRLQTTFERLAAKRQVVPMDEMAATARDALH